MLLALNLLLAFGGIALIHGYMNKRDLAAQATTLGTTAGESKSAAGATDSVSVGSDTPPPGGSDAGLGKTSEDGTKSSGTEEAATKSGVRPVSNPATDQVKKPGPPDAGAAPKPEQRPADAGRRRPTTPVGAGNSSTKPPRGGARRPDAGPFAQPPAPKESEEQEAERVRRLSAKIRLVVKRHRGQLDRCYQSAAKVRNPSETLEGKIRVHFDVHPDGFARNIGVISNNTGSVSLSKCIVGLVGSWTFPSSGGDALPFVWPFEFQAQ
jgi:hypothetical protein